MGDSHTPLMVHPSWHTLEMFIVSCMCSVISEVIMKVYGYVVFQKSSESNLHLAANDNRYLCASEHILLHSAQQR